MFKTVLKFLIFSLCTTLIFAACSSSSSSASKKDANGLKTAARTYVGYNFSDNRDGLYNGLTKSCRVHTSKKDVEHYLNQLKTVLKDNHVNPNKIKVEKIDVRKFETGKSGEVRIVLTESGSTQNSFFSQGLYQPQYQKFVYEDGGWRSTDCNLG